MSKKGSVVTGSSPAEKKRKLSAKHSSDKDDLKPFTLLLPFLRPTQVQAVAVIEKSCGSQPSIPLAVHKGAGVAFTWKSWSKTQGVASIAAAVLPSCLTTPDQL